MSNPINACLQDIIGLSQTPCDCWTDKPEDYNTSDSGLFLDELLPLNTFTNLGDCEDADVWSFMENARTEATKTTLNAVKSGLLKQYELAYTTFKGKIGEAKATSLIGFTTAYAGLIMRCNPIRSGKMKINAIGTFFNATGTKHVYVMDNLGNIHAEYNLITTANTYVNNALSTPLELPLYSEDTAILHYYIVYADDAIKPYNNTITCEHCSGFTPCWSTGNNCWLRPVKNNRYFWAKYLQVSGLTFNALADLYTTEFGYSNALYGLTVDVETWCNIDDVFCDSTVNYEGSLIHGALAEAIRFKAAEYTINKILTTDKLTRSKLINRESLITLKASFSVDFDDKVQYIADNLDISATSCLQCKDFYKAKISLARS